MNDDHSTTPAPTAQETIEAAVKPPPVPSRTGARPDPNIVIGAVVIIVAAIALVALTRPTVINADHGSRVNYSTKAQADVALP